MQSDTIAGMLQKDGEAFTYSLSLGELYDAVEALGLKNPRDIEIFSGYNPEVSEEGVWIALAEEDTK